MFNMEKVGQNISELRKAKNMTQMELADKLNISFQAVSNWERGNSMPDISKLPELSSLFEVTIDALLGEQSPLVQSAAKNEIDDYLAHNTITPDELAHIAPILKPAQVNNLSENINFTTLKELEDLIPFLSGNIKRKLTLQAIEKEDYDAIEILAPFADRQLLGDFAMKMIANEKYKYLDTVFPFLNKDVRYKLAELLYQKLGISGLADIAPFLGNDFLDKIAMKALEKISQ